jgi:hypothetical protein
MQLNQLIPMILNARTWVTGQPPLFLGEWLLTLPWGFRPAAAGDVDGYRLAMPILIERMSA